MSALSARIRPGETGLGIIFYEPAPVAGNEARRERAVEDSGALAIRDDPALEAVLNGLCRSFGVSMAAVSILHSDWQYLIATAGVPSGPCSRRTSFCGHAIQRPDEVLCVPDARDDPRFAGNPLVVEDGGIRFYAGAPLIGSAHLPLGAVCVFDTVPHPPVDQDGAERLKRAAADVAALIESHGADRFARRAATG